MPKPKRQPRQISPRVQGIFDRLRAMGVEVTPATVGPDHPLPEPIDIGAPLSDTVIEMRRWPGEPLEGWVREPEPLDWLPDPSEPPPSYKPRPVPPAIQELRRRLKEVGVTLTPSLAGPDYPIPEPVDLGPSPRDTAIERRRRP